jgi:hypothetical protein
MARAPAPALSRMVPSMSKRTSLRFTPAWARRPIATAQFRQSVTPRMVQMTQMKVSHELAG